jgi:type II secretion system protein D
MNSLNIRGLRRKSAAAGWSVALALICQSLLAVSLRSQDNNNPPQDRPQQPLQAPSQLQVPAGPGAPGGGPGGGPGGPGSNIVGDRVSLQFPLNPVNDILNIYERLVSKPIVKDSSIFNGPQISLVTPSDVSKDEAIRLIEAALLVNGYVLVIEPENDKQVKVLLGGARQGGGSPSFSEGVVIYTDPGMLPEGESLVGFFMELDYVDPEDAATIFSNHVVLNEFGRLTPVTNPRGLLITETSPIVRQFIRLKAIIDHPVDDAPLITEFVQLEFAESNVVAQIIQAAMDARMEERQRQGERNGTVSGSRSTAQPQSGQPQQQAQANQSNPQGQSAANQNTRSRNVMNGIGTADQPAAQLIPDDRLNRVMIVASPTDAAYILELIQQFDRPLDSHQPVERKLKYVKANDILPVLVDVLQDTGTGETMLPGGRQIQTRPTPVTSSQLSTLTGTNQNQQNNQNRNQQAGSTVDEVGGREDQISFPLDDVAPISVLVGKTRVIADRQSNSIIVSGTRESEQIVLDMIERLDRRPVQVYLATVIGELTLSDDTQVGVDFIQRFAKWNGTKPGSGGFTSGNLNGPNNIVPNGNISNMANMITSTPFGPSNGLNFYGQIGESLDVIVTALEETQRFKVLSRPVVYTQNGKRAEITSGQEVPYPETAVTDTDNPNSVRSTVAYKDVVLKLEVLPTINEDNEVTLDIVQINDRVVGQQLIDANEIPIIGKQELNTTVSVANRSTIILGGLISESKDVQDQGIPFLKDIPVIGYAAKNSNVSKTRSELMIFIQPIVVRSDEEATFTSYDEDVRSEIGEDAAATFPEPGNPTIMHRAEEVRDVEAEENPLKRLGQKLFGKQKVPREPLP